jgi:hypothetical protein
MYFSASNLGQTKLKIPTWVIIGLIIAAIATAAPILKDRYEDKQYYKKLKKKKTLSSFEYYDLSKLAKKFGNKEEQDIVEADRLNNLYRTTEKLSKKGTLDKIAKDLDSNS